MKLLAIFCLALTVLGEDFQIPLEENGEVFKEEVKIDVAGNTEEIQVPKHGNRLAISLFNDFDMGYSALKVFAQKTCYVMALSEKQTPAQMKKSMEVSHAKFPEERYMVEDHKYVALYEMTRSEVGDKVAAHCGDYPLMFSVQANKKSISKEVLKVAKELKGRKRSRDVRIFKTCNRSSADVIETCPEDHLQTVCQFKSQTGSCIYRVECLQNGYGSWTCNGVHRYHFKICCDFVCQS